MPPRRRRAGYRPGQLSPELRAAITAEAAALGELEEVSLDEAPITEPDAPPPEPPSTTTGPEAAAR